MTSDTLDPPPEARRSHHPLELFPFFSSRFAPGPVRDFIYTFIWSCLFGLAFFLMSMLAEGRLPTLRVLGLQMLVANFIGYSIHGLFILGDLVGLDDAARRGGFATKVVSVTVLIFFAFQFAVNFGGTFSDQEQTAHKQDQVAARNAKVI